MTGAVAGLAEDRAGARLAGRTLTRRLGGGLPGGMRGRGARRTATRAGRPRRAAAATTTAAPAMTARRRDSRLQGGRPARAVRRPRARGRAVRLRRVGRGTVRRHLGRLRRAPAGGGRLRRPRRGLVRRAGRGRASPRGQRGGEPLAVRREQQGDGGVVAAAVGRGAALGPHRNLVLEPAPAVPGGELGQVPGQGGLPRVADLRVAVAVGAQQQRQQRLGAQVPGAGPEGADRAGLAQAGGVVAVQVGVPADRGPGSAVGPDRRRRSPSPICAQTSQLRGDQRDDQGGAVGNVAARRAWPRARPLPPACTGAPPGARRPAGASASTTACGSSSRSRAACPASHGRSASAVSSAATARAAWTASWEPVALRKWRLAPCPSATAATTPARPAITADATLS